MKMVQTGHHYCKPLKEAIPDCSALVERWYSISPNPGLFEEVSSEAAALGFHL